jgi:hypothetical protein
MLTEKRSITSEKATAILEKEEIKISLEDAALVVDFMYVLALMCYKQSSDQ